ncbi:MAG: hypothetical protein K2Q20_14685, partial [Phycisphaerales bacterium]|nr:hypothetical protein [Phycisphaerales bacterium]
DAFNARTKQAQKLGDIDVIFLGDSITQGWEGAGKAAWEKTFAPLNAVNYGIGGDQTGHVLGRIASGNLDGLSTPAAGRPPRVVVLLIGTNNAGTQTPEQIAGGVKTIVERVQEKLPMAKVLLLAILPRGQTPGDREGVTVGRTNVLLAKLVDGERVRFLDIGSKLIDAGALERGVTPSVRLTDLEEWAKLVGSPGTLDPSLGAAVGLNDRIFATRSITAGPDGELQMHALEREGVRQLLVSRKVASGGADLALVRIREEPLPATPSNDLIGIRVRPGAGPERDFDAGHSVVQAWCNRYAMQTLDRSIFPDFLHLSAKGYDVWAEAMGPVVQEMLGQK